VLSFVAATAHTGTVHGAALTLLVYVAATCEIALAMVLVVLLARRRGSTDLAGAAELKG